jgi:hypothetical protein
MMGSHAHKHLSNDVQHGRFTLLQYNGTSTVQLERYKNIGSWYTPAKRIQTLSQHAPVSGISSPRLHALYIPLEKLKLEVKTI